MVRFFERGTGAVLDLLVCGGYRARERFLYPIVRGLILSGRKPGGKCPRIPGNSDLETALRGAAVTILFSACSSRGRGSDAPAATSWTAFFPEMMVVKA